MRRRAMRLGVHHLNFSVRDLDEALPFYRDLLGFEPIEGRPDGRGAGIYLGREGYPQINLNVKELPAPDPDAPFDVGAQHVCLLFEEFEALRDRIRAGSFPWKESPSFPPRIFVKDPSGNQFEIQPADAY
jgi:catechol 2,3-dioxygenase-like lactoylglutathione lyase family enzyme